ncbi:hypothetical protein AB4Y35_11255 [Paraburkholderia sp. EG286A]|uniref:hypothetical protein n=1 Tax=Paraburkholderia sp. EG286A TaxID=3237014 RepID=UPI0034D366CC
MNDDLEIRRARSSSDHRRLRSNPATTPWDLGDNYRRWLQTGVWPSQRALAAALSVSGSHVSRCISIALLPKLVLDALGGKKYVSFKLGKELSKLVREIEPYDLKKHALKVRGLKLVDPNEILQVLRSGDGPGRRNARLLISADRSGKVIRIEGPDVEKLTRNLGVVKDAIRECLNGINTISGFFGDMRAEHDPNLERP